MHYESRLLAIDDDGHFVLATHHGQFPIGGEDTRETKQAAFFLGHVDKPGELRDLGALCTIPRKASKAQAAYHQRAADGQGALARAGQGGKAFAQMYADNEIRMRHSAQLALEDAVRVPRRVFASRTGRLLVAFEASLAATTGEDLPGVLRVVDVRKGAVIAEASSSRSPVAPLGKLLQSLSFAQVGKPKAFSWDGERVLLMGDSGADVSKVIECTVGGKFAQVAVFPHAMHFGAARDAWLALDDKTVVLRGPKGEASEIAVPRGAVSWTAAITPDGAWIVMSGNGGAAWLVGTDGGKARRFNPHPGTNKDTFASVAISDCGRWMASRAGGDVVVTRVADGLSWPVGRLEERTLEEVSHGDYVIASSVPPAFGFVGSRLLLAQDLGVREASLDTPGEKAFVSEQGRAGARKPIKVPKDASFEALVKAAGLEPVAEAIRRHFSPAARMKSTPLKAAGWRTPPAAKAPGLGESRLGGWPDLPKDCAWPTWQSRPMAFLAQVNLAEAHAAQPGLRLPSSGVLSFFLACDETTHTVDGDPRERLLVDVMAGTGDHSRDAACVLYSRDAASLERRAWETTPLPELFDPCSVRFTKGGQPLADGQTIAYARLPLHETQREAYNELLGACAPPGDDAVEQLMGHPTLLQGNPPEMMCELSARGMNPWQWPDPKDAAYDGLAAAASDWGLLLQLTSQSGAGFEWGDGGHLYFYGHRAAMENGDFSGVWMNFEN